MDNNPNPSPSDEETEEVVEEESEGEESEQPGKKSAEARINELNAKLKQSEEEKAELKRLVDEKDKKVPTPPRPDEAKAKDYLKGLGTAFEEDVDKKIDAKIKAIEDRRALDNEHSRLASEYDGEDGRPKYDRAKVEEFMREHAVYDPQIAYESLNKVELLDWNLKKENSGKDKGKPYVEKPGSGGSTRSDPNAITRDKLQEVNDNPTPANKAWYEQNRSKILDMMAKGEL